MSDIAKLAARLAKASTVVTDELALAVTIGGELLGQGARQAMPSRLRGVGTSGATLGVSVSVRGHIRPAALVRATGAAHLVDLPTKAHTITARRAGALATPYGPKAGVHVKGTAGKRTFEKGVALALPGARAAIEAAFRRAPTLI